MRSLRSSLAAGATALVAGLAPGVAVAQGPDPGPQGVAADAAHAPPGTGPLGPLCTAASASFRTWWSDAPGAPGALHDADGDCATLPQAARDALDAAEVGRLAAIRMGFPRVVGDAPPVLPARPDLTRSLRAMAPGPRLWALRKLGPLDRGRYLGSLTATRRARILRGLPRPAVLTMRREAARHRTGRPIDFVGGDRRVDIVLDGGAVTEWLRPDQSAAGVQRLGVQRCQRQLIEGEWRMRHNWMAVLEVPGDIAFRSTVVHEAFHSVQCMFPYRDGRSRLLTEGAAEWFAAETMPAHFPGGVRRDGNYFWITEGNMRVASFCTRFDPLDGAGLGPYQSWPVWQALIAGHPSPSALLAPLHLRSWAHNGDGAEVIAAVGHDRWVDGLAAAVGSLCGQLRSPDAGITFAPEVQLYVGLPGPVLREREPAATVVVPTAGTAGTYAIWNPAGAAAVSVRLSAPGIPPEQLARGVVFATASGEEPLRVVDGALVAEMSPAMIAHRWVNITIANPSATDPTTVNLSLEVDRPGG